MSALLTNPFFLSSFIIFVLPALPLGIAALYVGSDVAYKTTLRRSSHDKWGSEPPADLDEEAKQMYALGAAWAEENRAHCREIHILHRGLNLYGEFFDLGKDLTVIILSGRTESRSYGYYFAIPYAAHCNVVVLDPRAHGKSDGLYNTVGFEESRDLIAWIRHLQAEHGVRDVLLHGICIGAACGVLALTADDRPSGVVGIVTEGMFANFGESVKNHLIEQHRPAFILHFMDKRMQHYTGHSMKRGPIDVIDRLDLPLLMLQSREDRYSTPAFAAQLYQKAGTKRKRIVYFAHGKHSRLRPTDTALYDRSIAEFLGELRTQEASAGEKSPSCAL